jgi:hypothetical protein
MAWRRVIVIAAVGLLVSGFFAEILADRPPIRGWGEPGPKPWAWGDPDWPAYSKDTGIRGRRAIGDTGGLSHEPVGLAAEPIRSESLRRIQGRQGSPLRRYDVRVMGVTIAIRRQ